ncbi:hypothetical protein ACFL50_06630 [Candidatus Latescibacterota bacterium]
MKRYYNCFIIIVFILSFFSMNAFAQMTSEETAVVDTLQAHFRACRESDDYREIIKYFTPDAVNYGGGAFFSAGASIADEKIDPMYWRVANVITNENLIEYGKNIAKRKTIIASIPDLTHNVVPLNVNVNGNHAIAVTRHTTTWPINDGKASVYDTHRSIWMLKKINNEWKITSWIMSISWSQMTIQNSPY